MKATLTTQSISITFVLIFLINSCSNQVETKNNINPSIQENAVVYTTASGTDFRLTHTDTKPFKNLSQPFEYEVSVFVNPKKSFQSFIGVGGAITDASAEVFSKLPSSVQEELLKAYYDKEQGIGYSLLRTPIHSADFSSETFTYVSDADKNLGTFSIAHDRQYRIPMIKRALSAAGGSL